MDWIGARPAGSSARVEVSRSPKTVIATVRGIGVAVITSTCGGAPSALAAQGGPLLDAEPVLLVDDDEAEVGELDLVLAAGRACRSRCPPSPEAASSSASRRAAAASDPVSSATRVPSAAPPSIAGRGQVAEHAR